MKLFIVVFISLLTVAWCHVCSVYIDDELNPTYSSTTLDCTLDINNIKLKIEDDLSLFDRADRFLEFASILSLNGQSMITSLEMKRNVMLFLEEDERLPAYTMHSFLLNQILQNTKLSNFDVASSNMSLFNHGLAPSFGLVLHLDVRDYYSEEKERFLVDAFLPSLANACAYLHKWARVHVAIGIVLSTSNSSEEVIQTHWKMATILYEIFRETLADTDLSLHCYASAKVISANVGFEMENVVLHALPYDATFDWDLREYLCRYLYYSHHSPEYYVMLDDTIAVDTGHGNWILEALKPFEEGNGLFRGFGVGKLTNTTDHLVLMLHRTHFESFENASICDVSAPRNVNNELLDGIYSVFNANYRISLRHKVSATVNSNSRIIASSGDAKVRQLRSKLVSRLNSDVYRSNPLQLTQRDLEDESFKDETPSTRDNLKQAVRWPPSRPYKPQLYSSSAGNPARIAFITALFGTYELTLKSFARQNQPTDFICFTDRPDIPNANGGWIVDTHPYHLDSLQYDVDHNLTYELNSLHNNQHPFNIAKYYKMNFYRIPRLAQYDVVVWLDGTIQVHNVNTSGIVLDLIDAENQSIVVFQHNQDSTLKGEMHRSESVKYLSTRFLDHPQPYQNVTRQYEIYLSLGYNDTSAYWRSTLPSRDTTQFGLWQTCFVAFDVRRSDSLDFLRMWYDHNRKYSTQDQMSFPFVVQKLGILPHTLPALPDERLGELVRGSHEINTLFFKLEHGM